MATLRDILLKIDAVKKTRQITKAMNMVAAAKLRGAQMRAENFHPYATKFSEILSDLLRRVDPNTHPLLIKKKEVSRFDLLHFSGDRGLCGSFNTNLINTAKKWLDDQQANGIECSLTTVGKKGKDYFSKRDYNVITSHTNIYGKIDTSFIDQMTKIFIGRYMTDKVDEVYVIYSRFISMGKQEPTLIKLIPIEPEQNKDEQAELGAIDHLCEPDPEKLLAELLPKYISVQILNALLQNETSEHAARMSSMDNASKNCNELIENLTLVYNKARQAAITAELMDIVGGAEALKKA